jgi:hypothetical protein
MALSAPPLLTLLMAAWVTRSLWLGAMLLFERQQKSGDAYNLLWVLVFGFATLNILGLVARRFDTDRNRMNFGEILAVLVVIVAVVLLGSELLHMFKIFPIRLHTR